MSLVELCAVLMKLRPQLRGVPITYWRPDLEPQWRADPKSAQERADKTRGKWEVSVAGEYGGHECQGIGDTPEEAAQAAIDGAVESTRKWTEEALRKAGEATVDLREAEALARGGR